MPSGEQTPDIRQTRTDVNRTMQETHTHTNPRNPTMNTDQRLDRLEKRLGITDEPKTYSEQEARVKMGEGYQVDLQGLNGKEPWYLGGDGKVWIKGPDGDRISTDQGWTGNGRYTLHGIHPKAAEFALQRLKAAGMVVGSEVEVVDGEGLSDWSPGTKVIVQEIIQKFIDTDRFGSLFAHRLKLVSSPKNDEDGPEHSDGPWAKGWNTRIPTPDPPEGYVWLLDDDGERVKRPVCYGEFRLYANRAMMWNAERAGNSSYYILTRLPDKGTLAWALQKCFDGRACVSESCKTKISFRPTQGQIVQEDQGQFVAFHITQERYAATDWEVQDESE